MKRITFQNEYYYHVYNRGVDKREVFLNKYDYIRFITSMREFNQKEPIGSLRIKKEQDENLRCPTPGNPGIGHLKLVDFVAYCLNPNHYHFIIKQKVDNGISEFMKRIGGGYTNYFNKRYNRSGSLFQGKFKAVKIETQEYLNYLSAYVNGNCEIHKTEKAEEYSWSSYLDYLGIRRGSICNKNLVLDGFNDEDDYMDYLNMVVEKSAERKDDLREMFLEN